MPCEKVVEGTIFTLHPWVAEFFILQKKEEEEEGRIALCQNSVGDGTAVNRDEIRLSLRDLSVKT